MWGQGQNLTFSAYGHVAFQIKAYDACSNIGSKYFAHGHTLNPGGGVKRSNHIFSESSHVAYQVKGTHTLDPWGGVKRSFFFSKWSCYISN